MVSPDSSTRDGIEIFNLGDFQLQSGEVLPGAFLAYKTFGDPTNPVIVNPTFYAGSIHDCARVITTSAASLNPTKYFIIVPALFGNGESTSPSNSPSLRGKFPVVTFADNVRAQYRLVTEKLGIKHLKAVLGFSMGGAQSYQWAVSYPNFVEAIVPICSSAKTSIHNNVFLEGVKSALIAARGGMSRGIGKGQEYPSDQPWTAHQREVGLKALGRVYAGWGFSQSWYRQKLYTEEFARAKDPDDFIVKFWEKWALTNDPDDLLVMLQTWQLGDISKSSTFGSLTAALESIQAKVLVCPSRTDLYFPPEDSQIEVYSMTPGRAELVVIPSVWGHWAGAPGDNKTDWEFLDNKIGEFLSSDSV